MVGKKGVEHCIFKEHAMGQGVKPSLERFAVRRRIKQEWGKLGFLLPELRRPKAAVADHKGSSEQHLWPALAAEKDNFLNPYMEAV